MKNKILLVEDDRFLIRTFSFKLESSGYEVLRLEDGIGVLDLVKKENPSLILLDIVMPTKNGFDVLRELQADADAKKVPVIVVSNLGQQKDIDEATRLGAVKYLVKANTSFQQLKEIIERQLAA